MKFRILKYLEVVSIFFLLYFSDLRNDPPAFEQFLRLITYPITAFLLVRTSLGKLTYTATRDWLLLILHFFAVLSFFWSVNPSESSEQLKALVRTFLIGIYIATSYSPKEQMGLLRAILGTTAIMSLLASIFLPSWGTDVFNGSIAWRGIYQHKQYLARNMTIGSITSIFSLCISKRYWWQKIAILAVQLLVLYKADSKTGIALFLLSILIMPVYNIAKQKFRVREIIITVIFIFSSILCIFLFSNIEIILVDVLNKNLELNGRTPIWEGVIRVVLQRPWFGYGYSAFWSSSHSWEAIKDLWVSQKEKTYAHNGFLDIFAELGSIGLILLSLNILLILSKIIRLIFKNPKIEYVWMFAIIILILCFNLGDGNIFLEYSYIWIYYISISLSSSIELEMMKKQSLQLKTNSS